MSSKYSIINPEFTFDFDGKPYTIRKASLDKVIAYQIKLQELKENKDPSADQRIVAFAIWLMLKDQEKDITEEIILEKLPGTINVLECLAELGFIDPSRVEMAKAITERVMKEATLGSSSQPSQSEPDGLPIKSEISA